jgi:hypothetical protein
MIAQANENDGHDYNNGWNSVVTALHAHHPYYHPRKVETYYDQAQRSLLKHKNIAGSHGVLDCIKAYAKTGKIPGKLRDDGL